jgi:hypothetical protein
MSALAEARMQILQAKEDRLLSLLSESKPTPEVVPKLKESQEDQWQRNKELDKRIQLLETLDQNEKIREELLEVPEKALPDEKVPESIKPGLPVPVVVEEKTVKGVSHTRIPLLEPINMKDALSGKVRLVKDTNLLQLSGLQTPPQVGSHKRATQEKMMEWHLTQAKNQPPPITMDKQEIVFSQPKLTNQLHEPLPSECTDLMLSSEKIEKVPITSNLKSTSR